MYTGMDTKNGWLYSIPMKIWEISWEETWVARNFAGLKPNLRRWSERRALCKCNVRHFCMARLGCCCLAPWLNKTGGQARGCDQVGGTHGTSFGLTGESFGLHWCSVLSCWKQFSTKPAINKHIFPQIFPSTNSLVQPYLIFFLTCNSRGHRLAHAAASESPGLGTICKVHRALHRTGSWNDSSASNNMGDIEGILCKDV